MGLAEAGGLLCIGAELGALKYLFSGPTPDFFTRGAGAASASKREFESTPNLSLIQQQGLW